MRTHKLAALTTIVVSLGLALPAPSVAERTKPATDASAAPDSWSRSAVYPPFELYGQIDDMPKTVKDEAHLSVTEWGFRYVGGALGNKLKVSETGGELVFHDRVITGWVSLPSGCRPLDVRRGQAVACVVPTQHRDGSFVEIWPRLGDDRINTTALPAQYRTWALTDAGVDQVRSGAGWDFINTASDSDTVDGGAGDDWIRVGSDGNVADGGAGDDKVVGGAEADELRGGEGDDNVGGLDGDDVLWGDAGDDVLAGKTGVDTGYTEGADTLRNVEVVR